MSTVPSAITNRAPEAARQSRPKEDLSGLMPYLRRYPFGIFIGLFMAVLMSFIGNALPLATGVMTDTLAGNAVPFEPPISIASSSSCASPSKAFSLSRHAGCSSEYPAISNSTFAMIS